MPLDFTGSPVWEDTITGPANGETVTGESVTDMGLLLANRTKWLASGHISMFSDSNDGGLTNYNGGDTLDLSAAGVELILASNSIVHATMLLPFMTCDPTYALDVTLVADNGSVALGNTTKLFNCASLVVVTGVFSLAAGTYNFYPRLAQFDGSTTINAGNYVLTAVITATNGV